MTTKNKKNVKKRIIELGKDTPRSEISIKREYVLNLDFMTPKGLDKVYATVPEVSRAVDLRGAAIIYRGYEISPRNNSKEAKDLTNLCSYIIEKSGGVSFIEQWNKNTDLYGNGYLEYITDDDGKILELALLHSENFGPELKEVYDENEFKYISQIKLDEETQQITGYATYKYDNDKEIFVNDKVIPLEKIEQLKYKVVGDNVLGVSLFQPAQGSIIRKLKIEKDIEIASRMVSAPKMVLKGSWANDEDAKDDAREAANLDINDVIVLENTEDFKFVTPGNIQLPQLREIFITNITTATGIPRPALTSESSEINKATLSELMRQLRENMRANMHKMAHTFTHKIFKKIAISYGYKNVEKILPIFTFPEDADTEEDIIKREEKKAATITSLANTLMLFNNMIVGSKNNPPNQELKKPLMESMNKALETFNQTVNTFTVNNDQNVATKEEVYPEGIVEPKEELKLSANIEKYIDDPQNLIEEVEREDSENINSVPQYTIDDEIYLIKQKDYLIERHNQLHEVYEYIKNNSEVWDINSGQLLTLPILTKKHQYYVNLMNELGIYHEIYYIGQELDEDLINN